VGGCTGGQRGRRSGSNFEQTATASGGQQTADTQHDTAARQQQQLRASTVYTHDTTRGHEDVAYKWLRQLLVVKEGIVERTFWTAGDASPTEQRINFGLLHVV